MIDTLAPHLSIAAGTAYFPRIYNLLVARSPVDPDFFYYDLAEKVEQPDETTWIFPLRPGVKIAPNELGVPERDMDAFDLFESFERIKSLPAATAANFVNNWFASHEAAADGMTYTITTPSPYAWFFFNLGAFTSMTPPRELLANDVERLQTTGVGGGPFSVAPGGYTESEGLKLNKNPNYYRTDPANNDAQLPYIDGMDLSIIPDRASLREAFLSAQTHTYMPESEDEADELTSGYEVDVASQGPVFAFVSVTLNIQQPQFDNQDVRRTLLN